MAILCIVIAVAGALFSTVYFSNRYVSQIPNLAVPQEETPQRTLVVVSSVRELCEVQSDVFVAAPVLVSDVGLDP